MNLISNLMNVLIYRYITIHSKLSWLDVFTNDISCSPGIEVQKLPRMFPNYCITQFILCYICTLIRKKILYNMKYWFCNLNNCPYDTSFHNLCLGDPFVSKWLTIELSYLVILYKELLAFLAYSLSVLLPRLWCS